MTISLFAFDGAPVFADGEYVSAGEGRITPYSRDNQAIVMNGQYAGVQGQTPIEPVVEERPDGGGSPVKIRPQPFKKVIVEPEIKQDNQNIAIISMLLAAYLNEEY